jgi:hypothetical protein
MRTYGYAANSNRLKELFQIVGKWGRNFHHLKTGITLFFLYKGKVKLPQCSTN